MQIIWGLRPITIILLDIAEKKDKYGRHYNSFGISALRWDLRQVLKFIIEIEELEAQIKVLEDEIDLPGVKGYAARKTIREYNLHIEAIRKTTGFIPAKLSDNFMSFKTN